MGSDLRRARILAKLNSAGQASISDLAAEFHLSEMTIRRDLEALEFGGHARRVRGGAIAAQSRSYEPPIILRANQEHEAKMRIGRAAAELLADGETTIITSSLRIATELTSKPQVRTIVTGGVVRKGELSLIGARAEGSFSDLNCDSVFLGVAGIAATKGLTEYNLEDTRVKQEAIKAASRVIVLADASKIGKIAFASVAALKEVDILVTNAAPSNEEIKKFKRLGIDVIHVEPIAQEGK